MVPDWDGPYEYVGFFLPVLVVLPYNLGYNEHFFQKMEKRLGIIRGNLFYCHVLIYNCNEKSVD
jgi:hypothetical protein